jgi:hypothetical protein
MRRYVPPPLKALEQVAPAGDDPKTEAVREDAYRKGVIAGEEAGYAAGFAEGRKQAAADCVEESKELHAELRIAKAAGGLGAALAELLATREQDRRLIEGHTRVAVAEALEVLFPLLMQETGGRELARLVSDTASARKSERISIRAADDTIDAIVRHGLPSRDSEQIVLMPDPTLRPGAISAAWEGGGLTFDPHDLLRRVTEAFVPIEMRKDDNDE